MMELVERQALEEFHEVNSHQENLAVLVIHLVKLGTAKMNE